MDDIQRKINAIEKEMHDTPYHKGTEHYIGKLRAQLAILKAKIQDSGSRKGGGGGAGFAVAKHGDATVVLVGFPSVGKSTLLNKITTAYSRTAEYAFTTVSVIPGMMKYKGASIQILDVPGLIEGAAAGKGRGRKVLSVVRSADLLAVIVESGKEKDFDKIEKELYENGVRINQAPPNVEVRKTIRGGLKINSTVRQDLDKDTVGEVCREFRITNAEITLKENVTLDRLIDALVSNRIYTKAIWIVNKIDKHRFDPKKVSRDTVVGISSDKDIGLEELKEAIWNALGLVRVYLKEPGKEIDYKFPLIVKKSFNISDVMDKISTEFKEGIKEVKIWGPGARFPGQTVSFSTRVEDNMQIMFV